MKFNVQTDREQDGRWIAEVEELPGVLAYGATAEEATERALALAERVLEERREHGELEDISAERRAHWEAALAKNAVDPRQNITLEEYHAARTTHPLILAMATMPMAERQLTPEERAILSEIAKNRQLESRAAELSAKIQQRQSSPNPLTREEHQTPPADRGVREAESTLSPEVERRAQAALSRRTGELLTIEEMDALWAARSKVSK